ncbi:hypothetical protein [Streptomyces sp. AM8-1-1]|uniref:hypothetical protein n=1 Tax=Streptomyces sp. AM8-1-1 TaxID=3075825 RepID=UPI0028C4C329|nr:hypothetical protein [Streptomyces sp. AM8-1-1]WNO70150.1 hypothetical protein RPQ07_00180 [Streptomyces sp. AM8-1-1]WNO76966.1 hypothetical protein RPQ07_37545 [Streptomyces sp. AM8-1-1]
MGIEPSVLVIPGALGIIAFALLYAGVILPTIWSRHPDRRAAAHRTLDTLLKARHRLRRNRL